MNDNTTTIEDLKQIIKQFNKERDWEQFHNPKDLSIGIVSEATELLDIFKYKSEEQIEQIFNKNKHKVEQEVADILIMTLQFAQLNDIDITKSIQAKLSINAQNYPAHIVKGLNLKKEEY